LQCNHYNNAFVHRGFSFESALLDGMMLLQEKDASNVLVGAIDEITNISHAILSRMGLYKTGAVSNLEIFENESKGTIAGEGASFFLLSNEPSPGDYAKLDGLKTFYKPNDEKEINDQVLSFLASHEVSLNDIDLVITGKNGDSRTDIKVDQLVKALFNENNTVNYKHLCGEYPTAAAFALWLAANIVRSGSVPSALDYNGPRERKIKRVLICNHYKQVHHSLLLVSAC
jgi:3-oxoacyl-(acyl-carrier-protein) synthase